MRDPEADARGAGRRRREVVERRGRAAGRGQVPRHHFGRRRGARQRGGRVQGARGAARLAGGERVSAQRLVPLQAPAVGRAARLPGLESGDEAHRPGRRGDRARLAHGAVRHAAPAWAGLLAEEREDHPDRSRPQEPRPGEEDHRRHLRRREGGRGGAARAHPEQDARVRRDESATRGDDQGGEGRVGEGTRRVDARARRVQPRRDRRSKEGTRPLAAPAPGAARAGESDAGARDGVHRHRQHQLGGEQLPALRGAAQLFRADELRQLRLRAADDDRRQVRRAAPPGRGLRGRRRLGHEHGGDHDLRAPRHSGHGGRVPQPPVGRREEEPGRLLQPALRRGRARQPELCGDCEGDGRRRHRRRQAGRRGQGAEDARSTCR